MYVQLDIYYEKPSGTCEEDYVYYKTEICIGVQSGQLLKCGAQKVQQPTSHSLHSEKKWSQNSASEEPFWKTAPLWQRGAIFLFIIMFGKKTALHKTEAQFQISFL